jgi:CBS domain-containing protein
MATIRHLLQVKGNDIWSIQPNATVFEALRLMADKDVGALLVIDNDRLVGIISERDYARKVILFNKASKDTFVSEIMTDRLFTVHPGQTAQECMELMTEKHIRHLPVVEDNTVLGVISIGDLVKDIIFQQRQAIKDLEERVSGREERGE